MKPAVYGQSSPAWYGPHARIRADAYVLLAALLTDPPSRDLLDLVREMRWDEDLPERMRSILTALSQAGRSCPEESIVDEYNRLFVGLGRGELVPYGSWYLEKMIQSAPLAAIRADLNKLGIIRQTESYESEDHAGALCESMALLSMPEYEVSDQAQAAFFDRHIAPWMPQFFTDLETVDKAEFYPTVGAFGRSFLEMERDYLQHRLEA